MRAPSAQLTVLSQAIRRRLEMTRRGIQGMTRLEWRVTTSIERVVKERETNAGTETRGRGAPHNSKPLHTIAQTGMRMIARRGGCLFNGRHWTRSVRGEESEPPKPHRPPHEVGTTYHRPPALQPRVAVPRTRRHVQGCPRDTI